MTTSCNKRCYTEREAGEILNKIHNKHGGIYGCARKKDVPKRKYYCETCNAWHLTHLGYYGYRKKRNKR